MKKKSFNALISLMQSPENKSELIYTNDALCSANKQYKVQNGKLYFLDMDSENSFKGERDLLDKMKAKAKYNLGGLYLFFVYAVSPVMPRIYFSKMKTYWQHICDTYATADKTVIQIGSGNDRVNNHVINIDIFDFPEVDIIADCTNLPFKNSSLDGVISLAVLEHVSNPEAFLLEAQRVVKPGGFIITGVPFIAGFHASPNDYYRWTKNGLKAFHNNNGFDEVETIPLAGPTAGMLWIMQEWLAIALSFNITPFYYFWWFLLTILTFPIKILDILFIHYKFAHRIESFYLFIGKKNGQKIE